MQGSSFQQIPETVDIEWWNTQEILDKCFYLNQIQN
jgi:hypothetical protein